MGCGTGCGCGPVYVNEVARMRDTIALMRETNMFSPGEVLAIKEAVASTRTKNFISTRHQPYRMSLLGEGASSTLS